MGATSPTVAASARQSQGSADFAVRPRGLRGWSVRAPAAPLFLRAPPHPDTAPRDSSPRSGGWSWACCRTL